MREESERRAAGLREKQTGTERQRDRKRVLPKFCVPTKAFVFGSLSPSGGQFVHTRDARLLHTTSQLSPLLLAASGA